MERLILDTSALISLERGRAAQTDVLPDDADVAICAATASELLVRVELADDQYGERRSELVEGTIELVEIIAFDLEIARHHATLLAHTRRAGEPRGAHDLQIAATAKATGRPVITAGAAGFEGLPESPTGFSVDAARST